METGQVNWLIGKIDLLADFLSYIFPISINGPKLLQNPEIR